MKDKAKNRITPEKQASNLQKSMPLKISILSYLTVITFGTQLKRLNVAKMPTSPENLKLLFRMNSMPNNDKPYSMNYAKNWSNDIVLSWMQPFMPHTPKAEVMNETITHISCLQAVRST